MAAVLRGEKTATSSLAVQYLSGEPLPRVGERLRLVDSAGTVRGEAETTRVTIVPLHQVGDDVARDEGEGFADAAAWRRAHVACWTGIIDLVRAEGGDPAWQLREAEPVVVQWIRLVRPAGAGPGDDAEVTEEVRLTTLTARPTAVVAATTTWEEFPALWGRLLGEVWDCLHAGGIHRGCRNVLLYLDHVPHVEVGVLLDRPCPLTGRVRASALPAGTAATTVHRGPFGDVGAAHDAVLGWCAAHGHRPDGTRWEVYGPHDDDPARQWVEVYWRVS